MTYYGAMRMYASRLLRPAIILLAACQQDPEVPTLGAPPIELRLSVSDSVLALNRPDTVRVDVTIKNTLSSAVRLTFSTVCQERVYIRNSANSIVLPSTGGYSCTPLITQLNLAPGQTVVRSYNWTGGSNFVPPAATSQLPAGRYLISATMTATNYAVSAFPIAVRLAASG